MTVGRHPANQSESSGQQRRLAEPARQSSPKVEHFVPFSPTTNLSPAETLALGSGEIGLASDGASSHCAQRWLEDELGTAKAYLTPSGTSALEVAMLACQLGPGDEVIVPSFTFTSTVNAFANLGATPVFVDVREQDLCIDADLVEEAISDRTKAILAVHYAGTIAPMEEIASIAREYDLVVVEDAAQALLSEAYGKRAGSFGAVACLSFHHTKNVSCGEGGAVLVNDPRMIEPIEISREKGTDRTSYLRGSVDKYTWRSRGTSGVLAEPLAALLATRLQNAHAITRARLDAVALYRALLSPLETAGKIRLPDFDPNNAGNGHFYYLLARTSEERQALLVHLAESGVQATTHYEPLHTSPHGKAFGRTGSSMGVTEYASARLLRLPTWPGVIQHLNHIAASIFGFFGHSFDPRESAS